MPQPEDEVPVEVRYKRQAKAAWNAAFDAMSNSYSTQEGVAKIEAAGRIAAALILSDRKGD